MRRLFLLLSVFGACLSAQTTQPVYVQPDCAFYFSLTTNTRFPPNGYDNRHNGCVTWAVTIYNSGYAPVSLEIDSAPDNGSGAPGAWGAFAGAVVAGVNPLVSTTSDFTALSGYNPWISVINGSTGAGTLTGFAYGFRVPPQTYTSGGLASNVTIVGPLGQALMAASIPVVIASDQSAVGVNLKQIGGANAHSDTAGNLYNFLACPNSAEVPLSGTGYTEIVAGTAAQVIHVCKVFVTSAATGAPTVNTFSVARATVSTCAGATELVSAAGVTGIDSDYGGALQSAASQSICVSETVANSDKVTITYSKF